MNIEKYIEEKHKNFKYPISFEYLELYKNFNNQKLIEILSTLHKLLVENYRKMNDMLPTSNYTMHFWAEQSRELIKVIDMIKELQRVFKNSIHEFELDTYYNEIIEMSQEFLCASGGSTIPTNMKKVRLYYTEPIFMHKNSISIDNGLVELYAKLKYKDEGSYANVYQYRDDFYNKNFILKRAKKDLNPKELERFKREFEQMKELKSPYIVEVFCYNEKDNEYIMEHMDITLDKYINNNNNQLTTAQRKNIANQILKAFKYIHLKGCLHRDISPKNILLKLYEDVVVVKISDFGLVKTKDSKLTTLETKCKGCFNDPGLEEEGFGQYNILHETYALTKIIYFIMTGKTKTSSISSINDTKLKEFIKKGLSGDKNIRYQSTDMLIKYFKEI